MKLLPLILLVMTLTGCSDAVPTGALKPPAKYLLAKKCPLPPIPDGDGDPVARADYDVKMRRCAARRGDQVSGLQAYARRVSSR